MTYSIRSLVAACPLSLSMAVGCTTTEPDQDAHESSETASTSGTPEASDGGDPQGDGSSTEMPPDDDGSTGDPDSPTNEPEAECDELRQRVENAAQAYAERQSLVGLSISIGSDRCEPWAMVWGDATIDTGEALTPEHLMRAGSATKTFTAALISTLAEDEMLSLDDDLAESGLEFEGAQDITIRQLLDHTSGLADYQYNESFRAALRDDPARVWAPQELVDFALEQERTATPGEQHAYANTNYVLAGMIAEKVTGLSYADALRDRVLDPAGLSETHLEGSASSSAPVASGYLVQGRRVPRDTSGSYHPSQVWSAGGLVSTPDELRHFYRTVLEGDLLTEDSRDELLDLVPIAFGGYGLGILGVRYNDFTAFGHDGAVMGFQTAVFHAPDFGVTAAVMHNQLNLDEVGELRTNPSALAVHLIDLMAGGEG